jgi:deoxycytidylate deaminase
VLVSCFLACAWQLESEEGQIGLHEWTARAEVSAGKLMIVNECLCLHAEENALLEAGKERIGEDSVIYCNTYVLSLPS